MADRARANARAATPLGLRIAAPGAKSGTQRTSGSGIRSSAPSRPEMYLPTPVRGAARGEALIPTDNKAAHGLAQDHAPAVHVIVVTHRGVAWIADCLRALRAQRTRARVELVVVDNGSSDGTSALLEREFSDAAVLRLPRNEGYGRANNAALRPALAAGG